MVAEPPPLILVTLILYTQRHSYPRPAPEWVTSGEEAFPLLGRVSRTAGPTFLLCLPLVSLSVHPSTELSFCSVKSPVLALEGPYLVGLVRGWEGA